MLLVDIRSSEASKALAGESSWPPPIIIMPLRVGTYRSARKGQTHLAHGGGISTGASIEKSVEHETAMNDR